MKIRILDFRKPHETAGVTFFPKFIVFTEIRDVLS